MHREDMARAGLGLMAFILPYAGIFTTIPIAAVFFLFPGLQLLSASLGLLLILEAVLSIIQITLPLYIIALSFVTSTVAPFSPKRFGSLVESIIFIIITIVVGFPVAIFVSSGDISVEKILFLSILSGLAGAFLNHVSNERDFTVPFGTAMVMWFFSFNFPLPGLQRILLICILALMLGIGAYFAKAADSDAVLSEAMICLLVVLFGGTSWFLLLLAFYLIGGGFTRYGYAQKKSLGIAQSRGGVRGYKNVYSNSLIPLVMAICFGIYGHDVFVYAFVGSVATANADTLASEIGETSRSKPRLITTLKETEPGVDGGVTTLGEAASLAGATIIGLLALISGMVGIIGFVAGIVGGFLGTNFDSLLGATLQRKGWLSNNGVNLVATAFGAFTGAIFWYMMKTI